MKSVESHVQGSNFGSDDGLIFIAEVGLNHNGNFGLFFELIKQAARANADIVKFQLGWRSGPGEMNALGTDELNLIFECCKYVGVPPMFSIFNNESLALLDCYDIKYYKISSRTVFENPTLAQRIIDRGKTTFASLGMWDGGDVPFGSCPNLKYLWCKSEYPAYPWRLQDFPKDFSRSNCCGYSDHSVGIDVPLLAIARGAKVIEKHFTLDKSDTTIRDHALSSTPDEFALMVELGRNIRKNLNFGV